MPDELKTTRLQPTEKLAEEYRTGAVEGVDNCWRDVSLRGIQPGPMVRPNKQFVLKQQTLKILDNTAVIERESQSYTDRIGRLMRYALTVDVHQDVSELKTIMNEVTQNIFKLQQLCAQKQADSQEAKELVKKINKQRELLLQDSNDGLLPLELFDSEDFYEIHSPAEWLEQHKRQFILPNGETKYGVPAFSRYLFDKKLAREQNIAELSLEPCFVTEYDSLSQTYLIQWITNKTQSFQSSIC